MLYREKLNGINFWMMGKDWIMWMLMWIKCIAAQCNYINNIHVCIAWLRWQSNLWVKFTVLSSTLNICYTKNDNAKSETYLTVTVYIYVPGEIDWAFSIITIRINKNETFENIMIIMLWTNRKISISNININKNCLYFLRVVCWVVYHLGCVRYFRLSYTRVFEFPRYIICKNNNLKHYSLERDGII